MMFFAVNFRISKLCHYSDSKGFTIVLEVCLQNRYVFFCQQVRCGFGGEEVHGGDIA